MRTERVLSIHPVAERGGSDHCLLRMVRALVEAGWECHIALPATSPMGEEFTAVGATLHVVPMRRVTTTAGPAYWIGYAALWPLTVWRLLRLARRIDAGIIHTNSLHSWYGWAVAAIARRPHIWHGREIVVQSRAALALERWLCRRFADRVVVCSTAVAAQLHPANVVVVHDVVGPEDGLSPARAGRFRAAAGIGDGVTLIGAAGRIDTWKGFDVLLDAAPAVLAARPDVEVVVAGGPVPGKEEYAEALARRAARLPAVHWLGPRRDMPDLYADLDLLVVPSTEPEPFASVAVEALASGVPVAATDHGGSPEMLAGLPPRSGTLFAPRDPEALAAAVLGALPDGPSSTPGRRGRPPIMVRQSPTFAEVFSEVLASATGFRASTRAG